MEDPRKVGNATANPRDTFHRYMRYAVSGTAYLLVTVALVADYGFDLLAKSPPLFLYLSGYMIATGILVPPSALAAILLGKKN